MKAAQLSNLDSEVERRIVLKTTKAIEVINDLSSHRCIGTVKIITISVLFHNVRYISAG